MVDIYLLPHAVVSSTFGTFNSKDHLLKAKITIFLIFKLVIYILFSFQFYCDTWHTTL